MAELEPTNDDPDVGLLLRAKSGELQCFDQLFRKHSKSLINFVMRFVRSQAEAEELAQEVFLKIFKALPRYEPRSRFRTYLWRVATNHCLNELRRRHHKEMFDSLDETRSTEKGEMRFELTDPGPRAVELIEGRELAEAAEAAVRALPEAQRAALLLLRQQGLSYDEISEALGTSVPAVKSLLNRAKSALKARLAPYLVEEDELSGVQESA